MQLKLYFLVISFLIRYTNSHKIITLDQYNFVAINDNIDGNNVKKWLKELSEAITLSKSNTVYILIDSQGGVVEAGNDLINQLEYYHLTGKSIECIAKNAFSMAFQIFQNCDKRYILSSSTLMQHQMSLNINGKLLNTLNYLKMIETMSIDLDRKTAKRINIGYNEYKELIQHDWWTYGEEIIDYNLADEMVIVGCSPELFEIYEDEIEIMVSDIVLTKKYKCPL